MAQRFGSTADSPAEKPARFGSVSDDPVDGPPGIPKLNNTPTPVNIYSGKPALPKAGETDKLAGGGRASLLTGAPNYEGQEGKPAPIDPDIQKFKQSHPHLYSILRGVGSDPGLMPFEMGGVAVVEDSGAKVIGGKILQAFKNKFGPELAKATKETQQDIAFALFKETHGAAPASAGEKVQAIKEMREALKTVKPPKPVEQFPNRGKVGEQLRKSPPSSETPGQTFGSPSPRAKVVPSQGGSLVPGETEPEVVDFPNRGKIGQQLKRKSVSSETPGQTFGAAKTPRAAQRGGINKLSGPAPKAEGEAATAATPKAPTKGPAASSASEKVQGIAKGIASQEKMTGEKFLKLPFKEQTRMIQKYDPTRGTVTKEMVQYYARLIDKMQ